MWMDLLWMVGPGEQEIIKAFCCAVTSLNTFKNSVRFLIQNQYGFKKQLGTFRTVRKGGDKRHRQSTVPRTEIF